MKRATFLTLLLLSGCGPNTSLSNIPLLNAFAPKQTTGWLGYGEGDYALIGAPEAGWVTSLSVERGQMVHRGDVLFTLDATAQAASRDQAEATLEQARASLAQQQANLDYTTKELSRQNGLAQAGAGTPATRDQAENNARQSRAQITQLQDQIRQTEATLAGATYTLSQRRIVAQTDGPVEDIYFRPGEYVAPATSVVSVLPPQNVYVRFFVPETDFAKVRLGERVRITCDGCTPVTATITFIAAQEEYTPPVIFSESVREKLVYKLEARAPGGLPVHPGQPVEVRPLT
jgi:HlyD family secretion protein